MPISAWSTTAATNATADSASGISWPEGMAPAQVNDSARAMMAEIKEWYDTIKIPTLFGAEGGTEPAVTAAGIGSAAQGLAVNFTATAGKVRIDAGCHYEKTATATATEVYSFIRLIAASGGATVATSQVQYTALDTRVQRGIGNASMGLVVTGLTVGTQYTVALYHYQSSALTAVSPRGQYITGINIG